MLHDFKHSKGVFFLGAITTALLFFCSSCGSSTMTTNVAKGVSEDYTIAGTVWVDMDNDEVFEPLDNDYYLANCPVVYSYSGGGGGTSYTAENGAYTVPLPDTGNTKLVFYTYPNPTDRLAYMGSEIGVDDYYDTQTHVTEVKWFASGRNHTANLRFWDS